MTTLEAIAGAAKSGTLYGIGVGPGDVRYMTLRAIGLVRSVDVLAYFAKKGREGNARKIVAPLLNGSLRELKFEYPVTDEISVADPEYPSTAPRRKLWATSSNAGIRLVSSPKAIPFSMAPSCTCGIG